MRLTAPGRAPAGPARLLVSTLVAVVACGVLCAHPADARTRAAVSPHAGSGPVLGLLGATQPNYTAEQAAGVRAVTVQASWASAEPTQGVFSAAYIDGSQFSEGIQQQIDAARADGLEVVLDVGLQYAPAWATTLGAGPRFVDQYGDVYSGAPASGDDVVNGFTDPAVQAAQGAYLAWLGTEITPGSIIAVREGGGPLGELRYPAPSYDGHTNCFWGYDASSQATLPASAKGWKPGTGSTAQATAFLTQYNENVVSYGVWLNSQLEEDFDTRILVLLPGWGQRPGGAATEEAALLAPHPVVDEYNEGLDWADLLNNLPDPSDSVAYTTYLDAQTVLPTLQLEDPADYLAHLVAGTSIRLGGENTGDGDLADLELSASRAQALDFYIFDWMGETQLSPNDGTDPSGPTLAQLGAVYADSTGPSSPQLSVTDSAVTTATEGQAYSASLSASGGDPTYTWSVSSGALPAGLTLDPTNGTISGVPTAAGLSRALVRVVDAAGDSAEVALSLVVAASDAPQRLTGLVVGIAATPDGGGYWLADAAGGVEPFGDAVFFGSMAGHSLNQPINHIVATPDGGGYWLVAADGGTFAFGDAGFFGSMGGRRLNAPVVDLAPTSDGRGYWLVASDGGIFAFGDAVFHGSMGGHPLNRPVVGIAADPATGGYWEVATDGGIFAFGAPFFGSTGSLRLTQPVNGMAAAPGGAGYWFVASDGGLFAFGGARFHGSLGGQRLDAPIVGMAADGATGGYWMVGADGGVFSAGAPFDGAA